MAAGKSEGHSEVSLDRHIARSHVFFSNISKFFDVAGVLAAQSGQLTVVVQQSRYF